MAMTVNDLRRRWALVTALRGVLMLIAGIYAVIWPIPALAVLVVVGGALLLIDGALGLWSLTFGGAKTGNYWFDVVRNALAVIVGILILLMPVLSTIGIATFVAYIVAIQAIIVGVMEIYVITREREHYMRIWPVVLSGVLYILFGIALLFAPLMGAIVAVIIGGWLAILFAVGLFGLAWKLNKGAGTTAA